jgi:HEAT repeat protein
MMETLHDYGFFDFLVNLYEYNKILDTMNQRRLSSMHIFISYSRGTPYIAEAIKDVLEKQGYKVWLDLDDIQGGTLWEQKIYDAIEKSSCMVVIVTKQALESAWIPKEISFAKQLNRDIVPIILERMENINEARIKLEIASYQDIDFVTQRRPSAEQKFLAAVANAKQRWEGTIRYIDGIKSQNVKAQKHAMLSVSDIGTKASDFSEYVIPMLKSDDWDIRLTAIETLSAIGDSRIVNTLIEFIDKSFEEYWEMEERKKYRPLDEKWLAIPTVTVSIAIDIAIDKLGRLGGFAAKKCLRGLAEDGNLEAIIALGRTKDIEAIDLLAKLIKNADIDWNSFYPDPQIVFACVWALGYIATENAALPLIDWLKSCIKLQKKGVDIYNATLVTGKSDDDAYYLWPELGLHYLADEFIEDESISVAAAAAIVVGKLGNLAASKPLLKLLRLTMIEHENSDTLLPHAAALGLGLLGDKSVLKKLEEALRECEEQSLYSYISEAIRLIKEKNIDLES